MRKIRDGILSAAENLKSLFLIIIIGALNACDVHEWPDEPEKMPLLLNMSYEKAYVYDTDMTPWEHSFNGNNVVEQCYGENYEHRLESGIKRYVIRAYPVSEKLRASQGNVQEFVYERDLYHGYEHEVLLDLQPGVYDLMVWSDMRPHSRADYFYNVENFSEIKLQGEHKGNNDWRDAFRGITRITIEPTIEEREPMTIEVDMQRPLAKYEFLTTDLKAFMDKEFEYLTKEAATRGEAPPTRVNTDDYKVVIYYSGFMPNTYNMKTDKPVDSTLGVMFESQLTVLNENEATLGFDYVFVNGKKSAVTVQIGLYDKDGRQVSLSDPINVPLQRDHHTIVRGSFLMSQASGGITINPDFEGNHNIVID